MDCIFCKIAASDTSTDLIYQDDQIVAFNDLYPKAPHHVLIIPREHIATMNDLTDKHTNLAGTMINTAKKIAADLGIAEDGYRVLMNCNKHGGQEVYHLHLHLLGGRPMTWPPG
jgi:histidine triad (HIT) family protein